MIETAVVILNFNGESLLPKFLPSVISHSGDAQVVVADNGSTDNSVVFVQTNFPTVRVIELGENFGFCGGYNRALKEVNATYYVVLNSDIEVTPGWLSPLIGTLRQDQTIAAVQPKILSYNKRGHFEYAGAGGGLIDSLGYPFCRGRVFDHVEEDHHQYDDTCEVFWASGACLVIRSSIFHRFNGFDETFFAHMEEIDLCWKIQRTDYKVYYNGASHVYHLGAGTLGYQSPKKTYLNFRNGLMLLFKHLNSFELAYKFPARIVLDWIAAIVFLLGGSGANCLAVFRAHADFAASFRSILERRKKLRKDFPRYSKRNIYNGVVLLNYYLFRKTVIKVNNPR
jgi:GT2 family glycosyltransferase